MSSFRDRFQRVIQKLDPRQFSRRSKSEHVHEPLESPSDLEGWLKAAETDSRNSTGFFHHLLNSELFSIGRRIEGGIQLAEYADGEQNPFFPVFWKRDDVPRELPAGVYRVAMPGRQLLELTRGRGRVVLNPGNRPFRIFSTQEIETILDRLLKEQATAVAHTMPPSDEPSVDPSLDLFQLLK